MPLIGGSGTFSGCTDAPEKQGKDSVPGVGEGDFYYTITVIIM